MAIERLDRLIHPGPSLFISPADEGDDSVLTSGILPSTGIAATTQLDSIEREFLRLLNAYRQSRGLNALAPIEKVSLACSRHSFDMGTRGYLSHVSPEGQGPKQRLQAVGYPLPASWCENIAAGVRYSSAQGVLNAWKASSGHNANLLRTGMRGVGVGRVVVSSSRYYVYWTLMLVSSAT